MCESSIADAERYLPLEMCTDLAATACSSCSRDSFSPCFLSARASVMDRSGMPSSLTSTETVCIYLTSRRIPSIF